MSPPTPVGNALWRSARGQLTSTPSDDETPLAQAVGSKKLFWEAGSLYAVNLLVRGAERVIRGARVEGADSDIDDLSSRRPSELVLIDLKSKAKLAISSRCRPAGKRKVRRE